MIRSLSSARRALALATLTALAACSGGGGSHAALPSAPAAPGGGGTSPSGKLVSTLVPPAKFSSATRVGPAATIGTLVMHVVVNQRDARGLTDYATAVSTPGDARYRQFLTAGEIGERFGASAADYADVAQYFADNGLRVGGWPQRLALTVSGPRAAFEKALGTTFAFYRSAEGHALLAPAGSIHFTRPLAVTAVADAIRDPQAKHTNYVRGGSGGPQNASLTGNSPQQMAAAFDYTGAYAAGFTGKGVTIGIIGTGPIAPQDFTTFKQQYGWNVAAALTQVNVQPGPAAKTQPVGNGSPTATPPPVTAPCTSSSNPNYSPSTSPTATCNPEDGEAQLDTESATLAKDANIAFYLAYVPNECGDPSQKSCPSAPDPTTGYGYAYQGLAEADDEIEQAIADNNGSGGPDVLSLSYGGPEILQAFYETNQQGAYDPTAFGAAEFSALAAEGVAVFVSSGDQGAQTCAPFSLARENQNCVSYPAGDASVSSVGGVFVPLNNAGQLLGPITAWGNQTGNGASGGGVSTIVPKPSWQTGPGVSASGRNQPDISLDGDPASGVGVIANTPFAASHLFVTGGTSVAAPQMAAMWALVLQACAQTASCAKAGGAHPYRLGNAAPLLWGIYNNPALYPTTIYDVTFGNNGQPGCIYNNSCDPNAPPPTPQPGYNAGVGYDNVTGLGVPFARHLIKAVVGV